jgi:Rrf2 family nitric oxide-sensitive transcriptional repressor
VISQTVEYALRAIVTIANYRGEPCTAQKISEITQVPAPYLSKLMQGLVRSGVVKSQRGLHGGFVLTKDAGELTIWEIVDAVEPMKRIEECPLGITSHGSELCPLHRRLADAIEVVEQMFRETTIEDVISAPGRPTPLCDDRSMVQIKLDQTKPKKKTKKK